jgi:hypothetical protein
VPTASNDEGAIVWHACLGHLIGLPANHSQQVVAVRFTDFSHAHLLKKEKLVRNSPRSRWHRKKRFQFTNVIAGRQIQTCSMRQSCLISKAHHASIHQGVLGILKFPNLVSTHCEKIPVCEEEDTDKTYSGWQSIRG